MPMLPGIFPENSLIKTTHFDPEMAQLADRHYSRRTVGARQFAYSGRKLVLRNPAGTVLFVWMYPDPQYRMDHQVGYNCSIFRNESTRLSSDIILEAEERAFEYWGPNRLYTFVNAKMIKSPNPGYCFQVAGWHKAGLTQSGKVILSKHVTWPDFVPTSSRSAWRRSWAGDGVLRTRRRGKWASPAWARGSR